MFPEKQAFHCFGCGKGGNAAVFLMEMKNIPMNKAVDILAKKAGITHTPDDISKKQQAALIQNLYNIYKDACIFYQEKLKSDDGKASRDYLESREINEDSIKSFKVGYAPGYGDSLYKYLTAKGYDEDFMIESGLIKVSETGPYDMFRHRVMFPIIDENKRVIGFSGRRLSDGEEAKRQPKYINSPETLIFNKSTALFGIQHAKSTSKNFIILCEGNLDVITMHQYGFTNAVATMGTALTPAHLPILAKYTNNVLLLFDSDEAGKKATMRAIYVLGDSTLNVKVATLNPYKDADELLRNAGAKYMNDRIMLSQSVIDAQLEITASKFDLSNDDPTIRDAERAAYLQQAMKFAMEYANTKREKHSMSQGMERTRD